GNLFALPIYALAWRAGRVGGSAKLKIPPHWSPAGLVGTLQAVAPEIASPLLKSLLWAGVGASLTVLLAWPLAWATRRAGPWRWVVAAAVALILATPGPLAGMALVLAYRDLPVIYDTPAILTFAYAMRTLPYALLVLWPALRTLPDAQLDAAAMDGHGLWGQIRTVALPMTLVPLAAAWGVSFVLALGELPAALVVEPPSLTPLLTVRVWSLLHTGVESHLAGVGLVLLGVVGAAGLAAAGIIGWFIRVRSTEVGLRKIWSPRANSNRVDRMDRRP
ncbi:MAG: ABC transporter permease subunit, partial [Isosphaeraceae bacterium]